MDKFGSFVAKEKPGSNDYRQENHEEDERDLLDIDALLQELPERAREAVVLFYLEDRSYEEVALETLLFRARKHMIARVLESKLKKTSR